MSDEPRLKIVIIESPYSGEVEDNEAYAEACLFDSLLRGESPFASHLLYTRVLDDTIPEHRVLGMLAAREIMLRSDLTAVYMDRGLTDGMQEGIKHARRHQRPVEERWLSRYTPTGGSSGERP
jgi:hypothetical protein